MATLDELENGLRKAHAAGNADHARAFAAEIRKMREQPASPFAGVESGASPTVSHGAPMGDRIADAGRDLGRGLGLGARAMMQGGADLVGIVADPIIVGMNKAGANQATMRQGAGMLADKMGLPTPESAGERVSGDVTAALSGGGGLIGLSRRAATAAPGVVRAVGEGMSALPGMQLTSLLGGSGAAGVTREAGGSEGAQTIAGLAGGLSPFGIAGGRAAARGAFRGGETGRQTMERNIADFQALGAQPSVGQATGNRRTQGLESLLAGGPTSGGVMTRAAERQADDIGGGLQGLADNFAPRASAEKAGRATERGVDTFARNVGATKKALYWQADRFIPQTTQVPMANTWQKVVDLTSPTPGATATTAAMVNPKVSQLRQTLQQDLAVNGGQIPYEALKRIRTDIGEALGDYSLVSDTPTREYKALYAALSRDMEAAARAQGPEAVAAAKRANNYTRAAADRLESVNRVIDKNGGPERVYAAIMSGTRDGGTTLRAVMQSLPKEGQRQVTAAAIKRMGMANPGAQDAAGEVFSAQTFLTNWNKVSPEAKRALFDRHGPKFASDMDRIARVAGNIRDGSKVFANPSGTANRAAAYGYVGSLVVSLLNPAAFAGIASAGIGANFAARAMTSPKFVAWLARATEAPISSLPQMTLALKGIAKSEDDEEMMQFAESLEQPRPNGEADAP